ncbi:DNA nucleotidylexotransferase isoform X5 [Scophthalmus maximus]|uniref:DNA nucleotidylexotransferase isoform X5 n=1 Tax=Scophthalmus maximus TaxID=52904 RepID=UPI0015E064AA|nr:DNA nucleotidylexotransferase isoform X5 [Scophthalmus maximus]
MFHTPIVPRKRPRPVEAGVPRREQVKFENVRLYLVERKMGHSRRSFLTQLARSKGFMVEDVLSDTVTHVVSEDSQASALWTWLKGCDLKNLPSMHVLDISWFTDSMREGRPVAVETRHLVQDTVPTFPEGATPTPVATVSQYACQRRTSTENYNKIFTDILQCGRSFEVEKILSDERYQTLKLFTSVFGVGPKTAEKWYRAGLRSFSDILTEPSIHLNRMQQTGFLHYKDISRAVSKAEARALGNIIDEAVHAITPDAVLALTGGFRRGKEFGHDVDFLVTTPELGREKSLLPDIIDRLKQDTESGPRVQREGILLYCDYQASTFDISKLPSLRFEAMDLFAKCFLILRLKGSKVEGGLNSAAEDHRGWRAVRVDLVSPPMDRYAYALLGWTGSRQFERDLRRFARFERQMRLDNHILYDKTKNEFLAATTEKDIFDHLGLEYIEPWQRNA